MENKHGKRGNHGGEFRIGMHNFQQYYNSLFQDDSSSEDDLMYEVVSALAID
jgi:hypothetical protein